MLQNFHICIQVSDIDRSQHFYRELGFSPVTDLKHEDSEVSWNYLSHPDTDVLLELLQFKGNGEQAMEARERKKIRGLNHIGFHVQDLKIIKEKLEYLGFHSEEYGIRTGYKYLFTRGPDGEYLGFAEFVR